MLIQVCESMADPQTRMREVTALGEAMAEMKLPEGAIVICGEEEQINVKSGKINVEPTWRFLLNLHDTATYRGEPAPE